MNMTEGEIEIARAVYSVNNHLEHIKWLLIFFVVFVVLALSKLNGWGWWS